MMNANSLLWHNITHAPLETAIDAACARFVQRTGLPPTNVILPPGEWPETIGRLKVEVDRRVRPWHIEVYSVYVAGDVVCLSCGVVIRHDARITGGVSHGYCDEHKLVAMAEVEAHIAERQKIKQLELI